MALCRDEETNRKFRGAQRRGWVGVLGTGEGTLASGSGHAHTGTAAAPGWGQRGACEGVWWDLRMAPSCPAAHGAGTLCLALPSALASSPQRASLPPASHRRGVQNSFPTTCLLPVTGGPQRAGFGLDSLQNPPVPGPDCVRSWLRSGF